jgi:hypothetical protein
MKNITKIFAIALVVIGSASASFAQVGATATATASGTIVTPISISKDVDMNFGDVAVSSTAGTVVLGTDGSRSETGGVTLPIITGTVSAAEFTVAGTDGYAYTFTLPAAATTVSNGAETMLVDNWTSNSTGVITGGSIVVKVGATLNVGPSQAAGLYTSTAPFQVSVNYN